MIRRTTTAPWCTTGRSMALLSPMMATSGALMMGVEAMPPSLPVSWKQRSARCGRPANRHRFPSPRSDKMLTIAASARISPLADIEDSVRGTHIIIGEDVVIDAFVKIKPAGGGEPLMVPFTDTAVPEIDMKTRRIVVVPPATIE